MPIRPGFAHLSAQVGQADQGHQGDGGPGDQRRLGGICSLHAATSPRRRRCLRRIAATARSMSSGLVSRGCRRDVIRVDTPAEDFHQIGSVSGLSFADSGLRPAARYRYKVRVSSAGASPFSPIISATTLRRVPPCDDPGSCVVGHPDVPVKEMSRGPTGQSPDTGNAGAAEEGDVPQGRTGRDQALGMDRPIARRDFLNGVAGVAGTTLAAALSRRARRCGHRDAGPAGLLSAGAHRHARQPSRLVRDRASVPRRGRCAAAGDVRRRSITT